MQFWGKVFHDLDIGLCELKILWQYIYRLFLDHIFHTVRQLGQLMHLGGGGGSQPETKVTMVSFDAS